MLLQCTDYSQTFQDYSTWPHKHFLCTVCDPIMNCLKHVQNILCESLFSVKNWYLLLECTDFSQTFQDYSTWPQKHFLCRVHDPIINRLKHVQNIFWVPFFGLKLIFASTMHIWTQIFHDYSTWPQKHFSCRVRYPIMNRVEHVQNILCESLFRSKINIYFYRTLISLKLSRITPHDLTNIFV